jgi:hypothetical protein
MLKSRPRRLSVLGVATKGSRRGLVSPYLPTYLPTYLSSKLKFIDSMRERERRESFKERVKRSDNDHHELAGQGEGLPVELEPRGGCPVPWARNPRIVRGYQRCHITCHCLSICNAGALWGSVAAKGFR